MITRNFEITIRIPEQNYIPTLFQVVENDNDVYNLTIHITDGINEIDYSQVSSATITFALANGAVVQSDPERLTVSATGIIYQMGTSEIACPGKVTASIQLFGEDGERLTTARFQFEVVADLITPGAVQSESRFPILQQLVADVEQLKQDIVDLQIPDNSIMDEKLSNAAGQIKQRFASHMADYASAHGGTYHKNLLHNWDFRNPVNQRGFTSTTNAGYTIDRWRLTSSGHTVEVVSDGIKLIAGKNASLNNCFVQLVENYSSFVGVPLTLSIHIVENTLTQGCNLRWNDYASPVIMGTGYFSFTFTPSSLSYLQIGVQFANRDVDDGKYVIIDKMKLEIGSVSTLANDPPADYGEQLALCQRYALNTGNEFQIRASGYTTNTIIFSLPIPVTMRVNPSLASGTVEVVTPAGSPQSGFTFGYFVRSGVLSIVATKTSHGLTDATLKVTNAVFSSDL